MTQDVVIAAAKRTPVGSFNGCFASQPASDLGAVAVKAVLDETNVAPEEVDEVILGQILISGAGQNPARQAAHKAGVPFNKTAYQINQLCGSGLRAVALAYQAVRLDDARIVVAGGQESMTRAPHCAWLREGYKAGSVAFVDTMLKDALTCAFNGYHMGVTAENVARRWQLTRDQQDAFAAASQNKAEQAVKAGHFTAEITPVTVKTRREEKIISNDEYPRFGTSQENLAKLRPAFDKDGTVTAGNASGINDGAAALLVMTADEAQRRQVTPLARIVSWATAGVDPAVMGTGPIPASREALAKAGWQAADLDVIEANEAFAAQALAVNKELGFDPDKVNINGGAIALGHPVGASGARILTTLLYTLRRLKGKRGLATLCIGGGMGIAMCVEAY